VSKQKALVDLFIKLFSAEELRRFARYNFAEDVSSSLPGSRSPLIDLAEGLCEALESRNLVDRALFDAMRAERKYQAVEIGKVEALWTRPAEPHRPSPTFQVAPFTWLSDAQRTEVHRAAIASRLATPANLDALLSGLDPGFVATLDTNHNSAARLLTTLSQLNTTRNLRDGTIPLARWLENAALLTSGQDAEAVFTRALAQTQSDARVDSAIEPPATPDRELAGLQLELVLSRRDQTIAASFLIRGAAAARSVAKVLVPRHFAGHPAFRGENVPDCSAGTGWLIAPDLLITNHHVIVARDPDEPAIDPGDFTLQAGATTVQFDYLDPDTAVSTRQVAQLVVADPALDFALLRVPGADRPPLRLRQRPMQRDRAAPLRERVNVLQHPNGEAMRIGLRNNFVVHGDATWLSYLTDTHGGASGSPVCDDDWGVVALHRGYRDLTGAAVKLDGIAIKTENFGIQVPAILAWLASHAADVHREIVAAQSAL